MMKVVTVHRGARDGFQVARALEEAGMLERLVTDLYWPADQTWAQRLERRAPHQISSALRCRYANGLPGRAVTSKWFSGLVSLLSHKAPAIPYERKADLIRWCDRDLGRAAGELANATEAALLSYSYYGYSSFTAHRGPQPKILFQLHPHPASVRSILHRERELNSDCASSLDTEWELMLPDSDYRQLVEEVQMAQYWIAASRFTKETLVASGIPAERVAVIPYGSHLESFSPKENVRRSGGPLRLLFVGTLGQRKGIKYLLQSLELLPKGSVELTLCGRPVDDMALLKASKVPVRVFPSISAQGLREAYRAADLFVFPSLAEGFGHVLLEAMATGLPIIATSRTAAPDLIEEGREGFVVAPGKPEEIAAAIELFLQHPEWVASMGQQARRRAEYFSWARFRNEIRRCVSGIINPESAETRLEAQCLPG